MEFVSKKLAGIIQRVENFTVGSEIPNNHRLDVEKSTKYWEYFTISTKFLKHQQHFQLFQKLHNLEDLNSLDRHLMLFCASSNLAAVRWLMQLGGLSVRGHMCQGLNSHYYQHNSRGLYTHYKDSY